MREWAPRGYLPNDTQLGCGSSHLNPLCSSQWSIQPKWYLVGSDWNSIPLTAAGEKLRFTSSISQESDDFLSVSCVQLSPSLLGALQLLIQISDSLFFFFWLLWASGKEDSWLVYSTLFRPVNCLHALTSPANNSCVGFKWCERPHMFERIIYPCEIALSLTLRVSASNCVSLFFFFFSSLYWSSTICLFIFSPSLRNRNWNALYI